MMVFHIQGLTSLLLWREVLNWGLLWAAALPGWRLRRFLPWFACGSNWLTMTPWMMDRLTDGPARGSLYLYIISLCLLIPVVIHMIRFCLSINTCCLSVYTARTSCPRKPWLTALSKFNMQHFLARSKYLLIFSLFFQLNSVVCRKSKIHENICFFLPLNKH